MNLDGETITSGDSLKIVGFVFGTKPDATQHIKAIEKQFYERMWIVRNLRAAKWHRKDIQRIYEVVIRSAIEYASSVYHPLLTVGQRNRIEALQKKALRVIYGWHYSYPELLKMNLYLCQTKIATHIEICSNICKF